MPESAEKAETTIDPLTEGFSQSLASRGASTYTERNYRQALLQFSTWVKEQRGQTPDWPALRRDDFRYFLRFLGRGKLSRAAVQLRFSALRSFYKYLIQKAVVSASPVKNLSLPKLEKRNPIFLTVQQFAALADAPAKELEAASKSEDFDPTVY